jgi:fermentation-respiration switch protein FrsA (DUF1100 family)
MRFGTINTIILSALAIFSMACAYVNRTRTYNIADPVSQTQMTPVRPETWERRNVEVPLPDGNVLRGIAIIRPSPRANAIYFGDDAELAQAATLDLTQLAKKYNINVIFVDYRGRGASSGLTAVKNLPDDALRIFDKTSRLREELPTFAMGVSLGSIPATYLAAHRPLQGLVLIAPISSFDDVDMYPKKFKKRLLPWYLAPSASLLKMKRGFEIADKSEPIYQIPHVSAPLLLMHGEADSVIPTLCGKKVYDAAIGKKALLIVPGLGHNQLSMMDGPGESFLTRFMDECFGSTVISGVH